MTPEKTDRYLSNALEPERIPRYVPAPQPAIEAHQGSLPTSHYLWVLGRNRWRILGFIVFCMAITFLVCMEIEPVYEGTARVDVDRRAPAGIIGQDSQQMIPSNDADQFLNTQIEFIQSDGVLRPVVQRYNLLEKEKQFDNDSENTKYLANAPIKLKNLKVVRPPNSFILRISYRSTDRDLASDVANAIAKSYLEHTYEVRVKSTIGLSAFMERQIEELKAKMENSSQALAVFERELNVINPEEKTNILSARLLQLNTEYTTAQGDRVHKEAAYNSMRTGSLAAIEVSSQADALAKLQERVHESKQRLAEVKATYGPNYSEYRRAASELAELNQQYEDIRKEIMQRIDVDYRQANNREEMLKNSVAETKAEYDKLNLRSFEYQQRKREAEADKALYEELVRKIKEAGINAGFQNSSIRIADLARPGAKPVFPQKGMLLLMSFILSTVCAAGAAIITDLMDNTIKDPEQAQRTLHVDVVGTLPHVKKPELLNVFPKVITTAGESDLAPVSGSNGRNSYKHAVSYDEAIRTLRNSILLADFERRMNSILVTSASPGEGKSTTAAHLAIAHAEQGRKTLLIDADLRRPSQHKRFKLPNLIGLSTALTGVLTWRDSLKKIEGRPNLDVITSGPSSRRASDLIGSMMVELLEEASRDYDLIIVDAPPLLGFAEPLQIAIAVDGVVVVTRAGETSRKAVATVLSTLDRLRVTVVGLALNQVKKEMSDTYYYYGYYRKYYALNPGNV